MNENESASVDETRREEFKSLWIADRPQPIEKFLPQVDEPAYLPSLIDLVLLELEFTWKTSRPSVDSHEVTLRKPPTVEGYLARFPVLNRADTVLRLLKQEYLVRHQFGDRPTADELARRFPAIVRDKSQLEEMLPAQHHRPREISEGPGTVIGPYKILQEIGEGGFGVVYVA